MGFCQDRGTTWEMEPAAGEKLRVEGRGEGDLSNAFVV